MKLNIQNQVSKQYGLFGLEIEGLEKKMIETFFGFFLVFSDSKTHKEVCTVCAIKNAQHVEGYSERVDCSNGLCVPYT